MEGNFKNLNTDFLKENKPKQEVVLTSLNSINFQTENEVGANSKSGEEINNVNENNVNDDYDYYTNNFIINSLQKFLRSDEYVENSNKDFNELDEKYDSLIAEINEKLILIKDIFLEDNQSKRPRFYLGSLQLNVNFNGTNRVLNIKESFEKIGMLKQKYLRIYHYHKKTYDLDESKINKATYLMFKEFFVNKLIIENKKITSLLKLIRLLEETYDSKAAGMALGGISCLLKDLEEIYNEKDLTEMKNI